MPPVFIRAKRTAATLFEFVTRVDPTPAPDATTSEEKPSGEGTMISPDDGLAETMASTPPMEVPVGSVPVVLTLTVTWVGWNVNGTTTVLEVIIRVESIL